MAIPPLAAKSVTIAPMLSSPCFGSLRIDWSLGYRLIHSVSAADLGSWYTALASSCSACSRQSFGRYGTSVTRKMKNGNTANSHEYAMAAAQVNRLSSAISRWRFLRNVHVPTVRRTGTTSRRRAMGG
jgi:hypothetical protein